MTNDHKAMNYYREYAAYCGVQADESTFLAPTWREWQRNALITMSMHAVFVAQQCGYKTRPLYR